MEEMGKKNYLFVCKKNAVDIMIMIMPFLRTNFVIIVLPEIINTKNKIWIRRMKE